MALKKSNRIKILAQYEAANEGALVIVGRQAVGFVKQIMTQKGIVDTGNLRSSITSATSTSKAVATPERGKGGSSVTAKANDLVGQPERGHLVIGTNVHYAPHIEFGTVKKPGGRPYLRPGILNNKDILGRTYAKAMRGLTR